jgi:uncharacterized membrane protein
VKEAVGKGEEKGGTPLRNALDGTYLGTLLHPALSDVPVGSWTAALVFDAVDLVSGSKAARNAATKERRG